MKNKSITIAAMLAVMVAMTGIASANPWDLIMNQGSPNQNIVEQNNISMTPGTTHISSLYGQKFLGNTPQTFPLNYQLSCYIGNTKPFDTACDITDIVIGFNNNSVGITAPFPSLGPVIDNNISILATDSLNITLIQNPQDPIGTGFTLTVFGGPGTTGGEVASASRTIISVPPQQNVPEYPSIGPQIVSILGLVFLLFSRR